MLGIRARMINKLVTLLDGKTSQGVKYKFGDEIISKGVKFNAKNIENNLFPAKNPYRDESNYNVPEEANLISDIILDDWTDDAHTNSLIVKLVKNYINARNEISGRFKRDKFTLEVGDELPAGIVQLAKVYIAKKRKLKVGDKMAGRHGNKGVISRVLPVEDMPYMADGTAVEIVLNPLGVPSRMNIGQLFELHLGWAGRGLGDKIRYMMEEQMELNRIKDLISKIYKTPEADAWLKKASDAQVKELAEKLQSGVRFASPTFDGATEKDIEEMFDLAELDRSGKTTLFDGITGEAFSEEVTVGSMYMLKLHHLVDEKIHARSTGPYSLVTQQPLGGKAQFGGQRLGEMEVWALEAYGAAYTLQEFLTVKSDDVVGRTRMYESIVKGEQVLEPGLPESFNVLIRELQALALDVKLEEPSVEPLL